MLLIPCPHCGERDESEFDYGGRAVDFPALEAECAAWHTAIHLHQDTDSYLAEVWFHSAGCENWIRLQRNPKTHQFREVDETEAGAS